MSSPEKPNESEFQPEVFTAGDMVELNYDITKKVQIAPGDSLGVEDLIGKYGPGPFRVKSVRESPVGGQMLMIELGDGRFMPMSSQWMRKQNKS
ncbi:MAG: hypothetical protein AAB638_01890 [Patescibacteria group bacterium]